MTVWRENTRDKTEVVVTYTVHVRSKYDGYVGRMMLRMELAGNKKRGRDQISVMDAVREDMAVV